MDLALPWSPPGLETNKELPYDCTSLLRTLRSSSYDSMRTCFAASLNRIRLPSNKIQRPSKGTLRAFARPLKGHSKEFNIPLTSLQKAFKKAFESFLEGL